LAVFILGPIFTNLGLFQYFTDRQTLDYFRTITLYWIQFDLPGVFLNNIWPGAVNGSLWTLWYEFFFYIVVAVLGITRLLDRKVVLIAFIVSSGLYFIGRGAFYADLFRYFSAGMLFYLFRKQIKMNGWAALVSFILLALSAKTGYFSYAFTVFGTYLIFYLAFETRLNLHNFGKNGDFSYGIYIYAFPFQQIITHLFKNQLTPLENFLLAFPFTLLFAILSWHLVEKNALKLKKVPIFSGENSLIKNVLHSNNKDKANV
jgi:peptidoglycan/LPS O-acetylase OafA/YrhL